MLPPCHLIFIHCQFLIGSTPKDRFNVQVVEIKGCQSCGSTQWRGNYGNISRHLSLSSLSQQTRQYLGFLNAALLPHRESWGRNVARSLRSLAGVFMPFNQFPYCILMYYVFMMESTDFLLTIFISFRWKCVKISNTLSCLLSQNFNSKKQKSLFVINLMLGGSYPVGGWGHFVTPLNRSNLCPHTNGTCN